MRRPKPKRMRARRPRLSARPARAGPPAARRTPAKPREPLPIADLKWRCPPSTFPVQSSKDVPGILGIIDQHRAYVAINLGIRMEGVGYNIFVSGPPGTGRRTMVQAMLEDHAKGKPPADDWIYVQNFQDPNRPKALPMSAGHACEFKADMGQLLNEVRTDLQQAFQSKEYEAQLAPSLEAGDRMQEELLKGLQQSGEKEGFAVRTSKTGFTLIPIIEKRLMKPEEFEQLPEAQKEEIMHRQEKVNALVRDFVERVKEIQRQTHEKVEEYNRNLASTLLDHPVDRLLLKYGEEKDVVEYLKAVKLNMRQNYQDFLPQPAAPLPFLPSPPEKSFVEYEVNVIVDRTSDPRPPIVFEPNPTYYNLFGKVEKRQYMGGFYSDFTMIRGGSLHRANGGFLLVYARDVLMNPGSWEGLKRALKFSQVAPEDLGETMGYFATIGLKPLPIPLRVKVILIGSPYIYGLLAAYDEDLHRIFKVRADFDSVMDNSPQYLRSILNFVANACKEDHLLALDPGAMAAVAEYMARAAGSKDKLTTRFGVIRDVLREADYVAQHAGARFVTVEHVRKALDERVYRSDLIEQKIDEMIRKGMLLVDVKGAVVGQVNGLSVYILGDYSFGRPSRITAQTFVGQSGVIDIEREVELSGPIHEKGVMILSGLLAGKFAQKFPLALSATLCFEQSYSGVEGDSASAAEYFALISQLSGIPIRQDIAVTGSVNQKGRIQAIGGVNEKVEGFYKVCKLQGLTGTQGVLIPKSNVQELMLNDEVIEAVKAHQFRIYAMESVDDGIEVLTGVEAGRPGEKGDYPKGSVQQAVIEKLSDYRERFMEQEKGRRGRKRR